MGSCMIQAVHYTTAYPATALLVWGPARPPRAQGYKGKLKHRRGFCHPSCLANADTKTRDVSSGKSKAGGRADGNATMKWC